jgi:thioredoxin reductase/ferredoxin
MQPGDTALTPLLISLYIVPVLGLLIWYLAARGRREREALAAMEDAMASSMTEPPTLHPVIDINKCVGCKSCVAACPEQYAHRVLGMIRGKARLVGPSNCIGHGACRAACPVDAIELVFGTERRGVDIPFVKPDFETNVPGIYIAGELGGMGLIRNAVEQGRQAMESIQRLKGMGKPGRYDVIIVGAGPAGFAASLGAKQAGLNYLVLEQDTLGGTVSHFPRGKLVMTRPAELPIVGRMKFTETSKEKLLEFWQGVEQKTELNINYQERVTGIEHSADGFVVATTKGSYQTRACLLTIGRRGTPRQLGVPGEQLEKVTYRLIDPEQYRGMAVLIVGGGDSALEAAHSIAEEDGTEVALSYRSAAFTRAKAKNRDKVEALVAAGRVRLFLNSNVLEIREDSVLLDQEGKKLPLANDAVIISAGGILPTGFLKEVGINVETKYGAA